MGKQLGPTHDNGEPLNRAMRCHLNVECRRKRFRSYNMTTLKTLTIVAALLATATSLAMAQNGLPTGGYRPVAGGANGGGPAYGYVYGYGHSYGYGYRPYRRMYGYYPHYRHYRYRHY